MPEFVAHYAEVALKGRNRPEFARALRRNIMKALTGMDPKVTLAEGRFFVRAEGDPKAVASRLGNVFGISWYAPVKTIGNGYESIREAALGIAAQGDWMSFKVEPKRADKSYPLSSLELARKLGSDVVASTGKKVSLSSPDLTIHVDVLKEKALVYSDRQRGPGGLPVGSSGRVMHLFSGGIDSPVAAWLLMKRGCRPVYLHFYLAPTPQAAIESKITKLVKKLSVYGGKSSLVLVPFAEYQLETLGIPGDLEPSLFRRFMRMTAEALAPRFRAFGISTGDALSQAASQTLWNLASLDEGTTLPILRPLLTYDKDEIIDLARRIGTYDLALEEYKDCCAIISRHPKTRVKPGLVDDFVEKLDLKHLVWKSAESATILSYNPYTARTKSAPLMEVLKAGGAGTLQVPEAKL